MKRRVSFLLMLILALAFVFALSSCGDCDHVAGDPVKEITTEANCKTAERYDEVVRCTKCDAEMSRTSKKGETGAHIPAEPVYENIDVVDCKSGGKADEVIYCSVNRCGEVLERHNDVAYAAGEHTLVNRPTPIYDTNHENPKALEYCTVCSYQRLTPTTVSKPAAARAKAAKHDSLSDRCTYCNFVIGSFATSADSKNDADAKNNLKYTLNTATNEYRLDGIADKNAPVPQSIYVGTYNGLPVTEIAAEAFKGVAGIKYVTLGKQVEKIGANAFLGCRLDIVTAESLEKWCEIEFVNASANPLYVANKFSYSNDVTVNSTLSIPNTVTKISPYAFANIKASSIYIPATATDIGENAFFGCESLVNLHIASADRAFGANAFAECENIRNVYIDSLASWIKNSFGNEKANPLYYAKAFMIGQSKDAFAGKLEITASEIPSYAFANLCVTELKLNGVTYIESGAFYGCKNLTVINFGSNVNTIADSAFAGCAALTDIVIPNTVETIGNSAFENCSSLANVTFGTGVSSVGNAAFRGCSSIKTIKLPSVLTTLSDNIFENCTSLESAEFGAGLTEIGIAAFANCTSIKSFTFTANIKTIADDAFAGCTALDTLTLNDKLEVIGAGAFKNCKLLKEIKVPANVVSIGLGAFEGCSSVKKLTVPFVGANKDDRTANVHFGYIFGAEENWLIDEETKAPVKLIAPNNRGYVPYTLSDIVILSASTIGKYAFSGCDSIVTVSLPANLTKVEAYAFEECTSLTAVYFGSLYKWCSIEFENYSANPLVNANELYINNTLLTEVVIPAGITKILPYTFYGASEIVKVVIPEGVTEIGNDAFSHCIALNEVELPATLNKINARAFASCDAIESVVIADIAKWCDMDIADMFANPLYFADALYVGNSQTPVTKLTVPAGVRFVEDYAFAGSNFLSEINLPNGLVYVGNYAFYGCDNANLKSITLPGSVVVVGNSAFEACYALEDVTFGGVQAIGSRAFADCKALKEIAIPNTLAVIYSEAFSGCVAMTKATLGNAVENIGVSAFFGCSALTEINLPASLEFIGAHTFSGCSVLAKVTFGEASGWSVVVNEENVSVEASLATLKSYANSDWTK